MILLKNDEVIDFLT